MIVLTNLKAGSKATAEDRPVSPRASWLVNEPETGVIRKLALTADGLTMLCPTKGDKPVMVQIPLDELLGVLELGMAVKK